MPVKWLLYWQPNAGITVNTQILTEISQCVESSINGVKGGRWKSTLIFYRPITRDQSSQNDYPKDLLGVSLPEQPDKYYFVLRSHRLVFEADSNIQSIMEKAQSYKARIALTFEINLNVDAYHLDRNLANISLCDLYLHQSLFGDNIFWPNMDCSSNQKVCAAALRSIDLSSFSKNQILKGFQYQLGDFQLKVGKVALTAHAENLRGIAMEVEYLPLSSLDKSKQVMEDFVDILQEIVSSRSLPGHFTHIEPNFSEYGLTDHYSSQHTSLQYATVMTQLLTTLRN